MKLRDTLILFLFACIGARLLIAFIAKQVNRKWLRIMGFLALIPAYGFMSLFISGTRNHLGAFGEKIWWNPLRPVHAILYTLFAYFAITGNRKAWIYLFVDACIGLVSFLWVHSRNGDFSKAFL
jgi:uncharacterized membrane protein (GlpM family)